MRDPTSPVANPPRQRQSATFRWMAGLLLLGTIALYWRATGNDFVNFDDPLYVTANPLVQRGLTWDGVKSAFSTPTASNWHPVTVLSHMMDCQVFGLKPWGHHLTSVLLHALNATLLFVLLHQMTGAKWRSMLVAALFAVHPLRVESVAWVAERKDVLSGFFGLLALIFYARYVQAINKNPEPRNQNPKGRISSSSLKGLSKDPLSPSEGERGRGEGSVLSAGFRGSMRILSQLPPSTSYRLSLCCFALGLMSKPMLVTWPFVMLLLDYWPLDRWQRSELRAQRSDVQSSKFKVQGSRFVSLLREKIPFFLLAAGASIVTFGVQQHEGAVAAVDKLPLVARLGNALISYCRYLGKLFWPSDLAVYYPHPVHWPLPQVLLAGVLIVGVSGLFLVLRRPYPYLLVGWLLFLGTLVPVLGLVQVGGQSMADRYTYIPMIGVLILVVWAAADLTTVARWPQEVLPVAGCIAVALCMALTSQQLSYWKDSETLFRHALAVTEHNYIALEQVGNALNDKGQTDEAMRQYQEAIQLQPNYAKAYNNLGVAFARKGQNDEAIIQYQTALRLQPDYPEAHNNLGNALFRKGLLDDALAQYKEAVRQNPYHADAHFNLGIALGHKGQIDDAIRELREAIRLKPDNSSTHYNLGTALGKKGKMDEAIREFQEAIRLEPDNAGAHYNLGIALDKKARMDEAIHEFQEAIRLRPDYAIAHNHLGAALAQKGQIEAAIPHYKEALRLKPGYAEAQTNLDQALKMQTAPPGP